MKLIKKTKWEPGDIGLVSIKGDVGTLIRVGQWLNGDGFSQYEHAFVVVDNDQIVEARPGGAARASIHEHNTREAVFLCPPGITSDQRSAVVTAATGYIGTPYSFLDYAALAAHRLHLWTPGLKDYVASTKHMICSQLADQAYRDAGINLFDGKWPGYVTPESFLALTR